MWKWRARFSLRSLLLAMAVLCCLAAATGYEVNWIRQRREFREHPKFSFVVSPVDSRGSHGPWAPHLLWLVGEPGVAFMTMEVTDEELQYSDDVDPKLKSAPRMNVLRAHALFPEATIYATDDSGDVVEDLSEYWLSPVEGISQK